MPALRQLGNIAEMYLKNYLTDKNNGKESDRVRQRQLELAGYNREQIAQQAEAQDLNERIKQILGDPTGRIAQTLMASGQNKTGDIDLTQIPNVVQQQHQQDMSFKKDEGTQANALDVAHQSQLNQVLADRSYGNAYGTKQADSDAAANNVGQDVATANSLESGTRAGRVRSAGAISGAQAAGAAPYSVPTQFEDADGNDTPFKWNGKDWVPAPLPEGTRAKGARDLNPKTVAQKNQKADADHAITMLDQVQQYLDEFDRRGMTGPLSSRIADLSSGKIKAQELFKNPQDAQLAATFFSEMDLLSKLAAKVHGGTRGAASPQMTEQFKKIMGAIGSKEIVQGQLDAVRRVMNIYAEHPDSPDMLEIPGGSSAIDPRVPPAVDPTIQALLDRNKGAQK